MIIVCQLIAATVSMYIYVLKVALLCLLDWIGWKSPDTETERDMTIADPSLQQGLLRRTDSRVIISDPGRSLQKGYIKVRINKDLRNAKRKLIVGKTTGRESDENVNDCSTITAHPVRQQRSKTLPNIFMAHRTRTLSEQSEERDEIMPLPVIKCRPRRKSGTSVNHNRSPPSSPPTPKTFTLQAPTWKHFQTLTLPTNLSTTSSSDKITELQKSKNATSFSTSSIPQVLREIHQTIPVLKDSNRNELNSRASIRRKNGCSENLFENGKCKKIKVNEDSIITLNGRSYVLLSQRV